MERLLLIVTIATLTSCQFASIIPADKYTEPEPIEITQEEKPYSDVWERIAENSSIQNQQLDAVTIKYINNYLENPAQFNKLLLKGQYFIYFVLEELERYNLPPELALLPYIESNYDPFSISSSGAMGLWQ
ncbi:MAG: transglycosylase SLT domain-containing protein, partial [SAR86 cluster bacterium]|nr:transglycosylase SLT domain-containing protein [SAR86 cluster bacterium]